jgi:tetratricopeptide (TPR) repeat protein
MFRTIIIIILLSVIVKLNGQVTGDFKYTDSLTYSLYIEKSWDNLVTEGNSAIKNGLDYYYLRMRIGIAYYEKHNYARSAMHFRKALELNAKDQIALEYLFYSYYLSGHSSQALTLLPLFYPQNKARILKESNFKKNRLTIESFYSDAGTEAVLSEPDTYFSDTESGNQIVTKYFINNAIYASHTIGNNISYSHAFTNLVKDNHLHYYDGTSSVDLYPQRVIQNQYYGSFSFFSSSGWVISPSFHFLTATYPLIYISTPGMNSSADTYNVRSNGYVTGAALKKNMGFVEIGGEVGYSYLNFLKHVQGTASLKFYPFGNSDIYVGGKISAGKELEENNSDIKIISGFTAGFSISGKVWLEFSGLAGDLKNYVSDNGLYVYNSADVLESKFSGNIIIPISKTGLTIFAGGGISSYSSEFIPDDGLISNSTNELNYNNLNFTGGISWDF